MTPNLIAALEATVHRVLDHLGRELADLDLTHGEINALFHLTPDPVPVSALIAATGQRPSTMTGVLARLERRGLLVRERSPDDGRSHLVRPTSTGTTAGDRVRAAFTRLQHDAASAVSPATQRAFLRMLAALDDSAG